MPVCTSDIILGWLHEDGYSLGESGWMNLLTGQRWTQPDKCNRLDYAVGA